MIDNRLPFAATGLKSKLFQSVVNYSPNRLRETSELHTACVEHFTVIPRVIMWTLLPFNRHECSLIVYKLASASKRTHLFSLTRARQLNRISIDNLTVCVRLRAAQVRYNQLKNYVKSSPVTGLEWPRGFQEFKVPRFHDNGTGWW